MRNSNSNRLQKIMLIILALALVFALTACATTDTPPATIPDAAPEQSENAPDSTTPAAESVPEAYQLTLELYHTALSEQWDAGTLMEQGVNYLTAACYGEEPLENIGYSVTDLDNDGTPELVIGATANVSDDFYRQLIFDIYALDENGAARPVCASAERNRYYYAGGILFANLGSSSASDSFETTLKYEDQELIDMTQTTDPADYVQMELTPLSQWGK